MNPSPLHAETIVALLQSPQFLRATFSGPQRLQKSPILRITLRPLLLRNIPHLQISRFDQRKDHAENILPENLPTALADILAIGFANIHVTTTTEEIDLRLTKKLETNVTRKNRAAPTPPTPEPHNRNKNVALPEGSADPFLQLLGIMTPDGTIRPTMRHKFTQINEFLKLLAPLLPPNPNPSPHPPSPGIAIPGLPPLKILDAGSGSAYLTFAAHHYLTHIKKIPAQILGVDLNNDLIQKSLTNAAHLGSQNLTFQNAAINHANLHPDIILALHACDTATDDAIALTITTGAKILLAVPCCHKNLNQQIHIPALAPLHRHGILHQRLADLLTDTFRALVLRIMGYKTDVIEFVSPENTPKNLMIRAIKSVPPGDPKFVQEYLALKSFTAATPYLESLLPDHLRPLLRQ